MTHEKNIGNIGEAIAVKYLEENGFLIFATNWRYKHLEVDIIAQKNNVWHFVEVKTRTSLRFGLPEESISKQKMERLRRAAAAFLEIQKEWGLLQFDVIAIQMKHQVVTDLMFIEDVFF